MVIVFTTETSNHNMILKTEAGALECASRGVSRVAANATTAALVALLFAANAHAAVGYSVRSDTDKKLFSINLSTGVATELGSTGFADIEALAMNANGELYGVNPTTAQLIKCSTTTGACSAVGTMTDVPSSPLANAGLAFDPNGKLFLAINALVYTVDPAKALTTAIGPSGAAISGLASGKPTTNCASGLYAVGGNSDQGKFYCINTATGAASQLGTLNSNVALDGGLDADATTGRVLGITNAAAAQIYSVDPATMAVTSIKAVTLNGSPVGGFESLAVRRSVVASANNHAREVPTLGANNAWLIALAAAFVGCALRAFRSFAPRT